MSKPEAVIVIEPLWFLHQNYTTTSSL